MTWRFVSRDFLASAEARAKAEHENAQALRRALLREEARADSERAERIAEKEAGDRRYADLLARFTTLRLQGAQDPAPPILAPEPKEFDACKAAINAKFTGPRAALRAAALKKLASDRAKGVDEMEILAAIEQGETSMDGIPV